MADNKEAYTRRDKENVIWVHCPYCNNKLFPINEDTKIINMDYKCRSSHCKRIFKINIE